MNLNNPSVDDILKKADIVAIISSYIPLTKKGRNYWAVCPFHQDSNPSLSISPEKRIFKCFTCATGGDAIGFVMNFENISFVEALRKVAASAGVEISEKQMSNTEKQNIDRKETLYKINREALNFFNVLLNTTDEIAINAQKYLSERNISKQEIVEYEIGLTSSNALVVKALLDKGYTISEIEESGLGTMNEKNVPKDYFHDRIIFPIKDEQENVIGFSARTISGQDPKYINSKENLIFHKQELAYNIHKAAKTARSRQEIIVLEGFMDVISLNRIGITNCIAIMGTSLSDYHIELFKKLKAKVKLFLDDDMAGIIATLKAATKLINAKVDVEIIDNKTGLDPDELINQDKTNTLLEMIKTPIHPLQFVVEKLWSKTDVNNPSEIDKYVLKVVSWLNSTNDKIIIQKGIESLSKITKLNQEYISTLTPNVKQPIIVEEKKKEEIKITNKNIVEIEQLESYRRAESALFLSLLREQSYLEKIEKNAHYMIHQDIRNAVRHLIKEYKENNYAGNDFNLALKLLEPNNYAGFSQKAFAIINDPVQKDVSIGEKTIDDAFSTLKKYELDKVNTELNNQLKETDNEIEKLEILDNIKQNNKRIEKLIKARKGY